MSIHATLLVGWSGTLAFLAVWFALLARLRPEERLFRVFAGAALSTGLSMLATAALLAASSPSIAAQARGLQLMGLGLAATLLPDLAAGLLPAETPRPRHGAITRGVGVTFAVLAASGWLVDPSTQEGGLSVLGAIGAALLAAAVAPATWTVLKASIHTRGLGLVTIALGVAFAGGIVDLTLLAMDRPAWEFAPHSLGVAALAFGATLMQRAVSAEAELERSSALLARSLADVRDAERALVETRSRAALGELAAVIAHEVRNPLAVLRNAASSLRKPTTSSVDIETLVEIIQEETRRLDQLGRSLSRYAEPMPYRPEPVALEALFRDVGASVRRAHEGIAPAVEIEVEPTTLEAHADPSLLRQALVNVIDNAVRAMPNGGRVTVRARRGERDTTIEVLDDGEGMTDVVLSRARDPFFTTRPTGTGLGLALVDKVVRLHGGTLTLARREPRGTVVSITLAADAT